MAFSPYRTVVTNLILQRNCCHALNLHCNHWCDFNLHSKKLWGLLSCNQGYIVSINQSNVYPIAMWPMQPIRSPQLVTWLEEPIRSFMVVTWLTQPSKALKHSNIVHWIHAGNWYNASLMDCLRRKYIELKQIYFMDLPLKLISSTLGHSQWDTKIWKGYMT